MYQVLEYKGQDWTSVDVNWKSLRMMEYETVRRPRLQTAKRLRP